jgi:peroxiredoxin
MDRGGEDARHLISRLLRQRLPPLVMSDSQGEPVVLPSLGHGSSVIYLYPGSRDSPADGGDTPMVDAVQHRAFRDLQSEITSRHFGIAGISSEPPHGQYACARANRLTHALLADTECLLARELGLPTFEMDGTRWYQRLTLVVTGGHIRTVFFPVVAARSAAQALAWIKVQAP